MQFLKKDLFIYNFKNSRSDSFSDEGLEALYNHLVDIEASLSFMQDAIAIDCEFCEYGSLTEAAEDLGTEPEALKEGVIWVDYHDGSVIINSSALK